MFKSSQTLHSSVSGLTLDIETGPTAKRNGKNDRELAEELGGLTGTGNLKKVISGGIFPVPPGSRAAGCLMLCRQVGKMYTVTEVKLLGST